MRWFWSQYLDDEVDGRNPYASPLQARDLSGLPPATVVTSELDPDPNLDVAREAIDAFSADLRDAFGR